MTHAMFLAAAEKWQAAGRPDELLCSHDWRLMVMFCWVPSEGALREGVEPVLEEYVRVSKSTMDACRPGWYDRLLSTREYCDLCGERYRLENLVVCTKCLRNSCWRCITSARAPNGNRLHGCGGELVG